MGGVRGPGPEAGPWYVYGAISSPVVITDAEGSIVYLNPPAEAFWGVSLADVGGQAVAQVLPLAAPEWRSAAEWVEAAVLPALHSGVRIPGQMAGPGGALRPITLTGAWVTRQDERYAVLEIAAEPIAAGPRPPDWALRDALTGLHNLHYWEEQFPVRDGQPGAVLFFDLDGLKDLNDLSGHRSGDQALVIAAKAIANGLPPGSMAVRLGGDEFVAILGAEHAARAAAVGNGIVADAEAKAAATGLALPLHLSFGSETFAPGGLDAAVRAADDALYERKGVLLRTSGTGRIVLTRAGSRMVKRPTDALQGAPAPPSFIAGFDADFDGYFRRVYANALAQARWFVETVQPQPGCAAVEVAAGAGRITFDGGLAESIGASGQLLVTEPSEAQLEVARQRAHALGLDWVRFLAAKVETLPLAAGVADLILGSTFLHFTDPPTALQAMARAVRTGGRVAVNALLQWHTGAGWEEALEPVRREVAAIRREFRDFLASRAELEAAFASAGLVLDRVEVRPGEELAFPSVEVALGFLRQVQAVSLWLKGVPTSRHEAMREVFHERVRDLYPRFAPADWIMVADSIILVAHKP